MTWLLLVYALEIGYMPIDNYAMYDIEAPFLQQRKSFYTELESYIKIKKIFYIGGSIRTDMWSMNTERPNFFPHKAEYKLETGLKIKNINIGFKHVCLHPVMPQTREIPKMHYEQSYEEIFFRIESVTK